MAESTQTNRDDDLAMEVARLKREIANLKAQSRSGSRRHRAGCGPRCRGRDATDPQQSRHRRSLFGTLLGLLAGLAIAPDDGTTAASLVRSLSVRPARSPLSPSRILGC